jgi:hypothetical protein
VDPSDIGYEDVRWMELAPIVAFGVSEVETSVSVTIKNSRMYRDLNGVSETRLIHVYQMYPRQRIKWRTEDER